LTSRVNLCKCPEKETLDNTNNKSSFVLHLDSVDFQGQASVQVSLELFWTPRAGANDEINTKNKAILDKFNAAEAQAYEKMFVEKCQRAGKTCE
jgi:hypothetical protein